MGKRVLPRVVYHGCTQVVPKINEGGGIQNCVKMKLEQHHVPLVANSWEHFSMEPSILK